MKIPVYQITLPEYDVKTKPNHVNIGKKIDKIIKKYFINKKVAIRCLSSQEHKKKSIEDIIRIIKKLGTDRYNPKRGGDRYENIGKKDIDFFALDFNIKPNSKIMEKFIEPFYLYPPKIRKAKPIRLDVVIIYDLSKIKRVFHRYKGRTDIKKDGFVFKNPENKKGAILGIIKIL